MTVTEDEHGFNWNYQIRPWQQMPLELCKVVNVNMQGDDDDGQVNESTNLGCILPCQFQM